MFEGQQNKLAITAAEYSQYRPMFEGQQSKLAIYMWRIALYLKACLKSASSNSNRDSEFFRAEAQAMQTQRSCFVHISHFSLSCEA
jgi:hypothetical protein